MRSGTSFRLRSELTRVGSAAAGPPSAPGRPSVTHRLAAAADRDRGSATAGVLEADLRAAWAMVSADNTNASTLADTLDGRGLANYTPPTDPYALPEGRGLQRKLSDAVHKAISTGLHARASPRYKALLLSTKGPGASAFLTALPGICADTHLSDEHMRIACQFRLGLPIRVLTDAAVAGQLCPHLQCTRADAAGVRVYVDIPFEACQTICDQWGDHTLACKYGRRGRIGRHDHQVYALRKIFERAGATVVTSKQTLQAHMRRFDAPEGPASRHYTPDGMATFADGSRPIIWDNAITGFATARGNPGVDPGVAVRETEQAKIHKYQSALTAAPNPVIDEIHPVVQDSAGRMGVSGMNLLKSIAKRQASGTTRPAVGGTHQRDRDAATYLHYMLQVMGAELMRRQATVLLRAARLGSRRTHGGPPLDEEFGHGYFDGTWAAAFAATVHG